MIAMRSKCCIKFCITGVSGHDTLTLTLSRNLTELNANSRYFEKLMLTTSNLNINIY